MTEPGLQLHSFFISDIPVSVTVQDKASMQVNMNSIKTVTAAFFFLSLIPYPQDQFYLAFTL